MKIRLNNESNQSKQPNSAVILVLISIVGLLLRLYHLGVPSLWYDELKTVLRIQIPWSEIPHAIYHDQLTFLYYLILKLWTDIFGINEFSLRFPSLLFSTASILLIFKLAKELFNEKVGLYSALFLSISPYSIYYAQEAKMYALLWFFMIGAFWFFCKFIKSNQTPFLITYVLLITLTLYTIYHGVLFFVILNILYFTLPNTNKEMSKKWIFGQLLILLISLPAIIKFGDVAYHQRGIKWIQEVTNYFELICIIFTRTMAGIVGGFSQFIEIFLYSFLIIGAIITRPNHEKRKYAWKLSIKKEDYMLILWIVAPIVICFIINVFVYPLLTERTTRHVGFIHIPLIILIAKGLQKCPIKIRSILLIITIVVTFAMRLYPLYQYEYRVLHPENWREFSRQLHQRGGEDSLILTNLPVPVVDYYNSDYDIQHMKYVDSITKHSADKSFESIFIVYRFQLPKRYSREILQAKLPGYVLVENYFKHLNGFLWFQTR